MTSKRFVNFGILLVASFIAWTSLTRIAVARVIAPPDASVITVIKIAADVRYTIAAPHERLSSLLTLPVVHAQTNVCSAHCDKGILGGTGYEPQSTTTPGCLSNNCPTCDGPCHTYTCVFTGTSKACQQWTIAEGLNAPCNGCTNADSCKE